MPMFNAMLPGSTRKVWRGEKREMEIPTKPKDHVFILCSTV